MEKGAAPVGTKEVRQGLEMQVQSRLWALSGPKLGVAALAHCRLGALLDYHGSSPVAPANPDSGLADHHRNQDPNFDCGYGVDFGEMKG